MKLLLIDEEATALHAMTKYLKKENCVCETATTYRQGLRKIEAYSYDCVILNLSFSTTAPSNYGLHLIDTLQQNRTHTAIVIISKSNLLANKLLVFEKGVDDYLVKPFELPELHARLKSILRRKAFRGNKSLTINELIIDISARQVHINNKKLSLTKKEYDILLYLVRNKNRVVSKGSIAERLWGDHMDEANSFDFMYSHVKNLRKKLAKSGCDNYIKTIYGVGYKFETH